MSRKHGCRFPIHQTKERMYPCPICITDETTEKTDKEKLRCWVSLKDHLYKHCKLRIWTCPKCEWGFSTPQSAANHLRYGVCALSKCWDMHSYTAQLLRDFPEHLLKRVETLEKQAIEDAIQREINHHRRKYKANIPAKIDEGVQTVEVRGSMVDKATSCSVQDFHKPTVSDLFNKVRDCGFNLVVPTPLEKTAEETQPVNSISLPPVLLDIQKQFHEVLNPSIRRSNDDQQLTKIHLPRLTSSQISSGLLLQDVYSSSRRGSDEVPALVSPFQAPEEKKIIAQQAVMKQTTSSFDSTARESVDLRLPGDIEFIEGSMEPSAMIQENLKKSVECLEKDDFHASPLLRKEFWAPMLCLDLPVFPPVWLAYLTAKKRRILLIPKQEPDYSNGYWDEEAITKIIPLEKGVNRSEQPINQKRSQEESEPLISQEKSQEQPVNQEKDSLIHQRVLNIKREVIWVPDPEEPDYILNAQNSSKSTSAKPQEPENHLPVSSSFSLKKVKKEIVEHVNVNVNEMNPNSKQSNDKNNQTEKQNHNLDRNSYDYHKSYKSMEDHQGGNVVKIRCSSSLTEPLEKHRRLTEEFQLEENNSSQKNSFSPPKRFHKSNGKSPSHSQSRSSSRDHVHRPPSSSMSSLPSKTSESDYRSKDGTLWKNKKEKQQKPNPVKESSGFTVSFKELSQKILPSSMNCRGTSLRLGYECRKRAYEKERDRWNILQHGSKAAEKENVKKTESSRKGKYPSTTESRRQELRELREKRKEIDRRNRRKLLRY